MKQPAGLDLVCEIDYHAAAEATDGYSGSDIKLVCKEAAMRVLRRVFDRLEEAGSDVKARLVCACFIAFSFIICRITLDVITTADVQSALACTKPSARLLRDKYKKWQSEYESVLS